VTALHEYETWLEIACPIDGARVIVCGLFSRVRVAIPFAERESVTFWPAHGQSHRFQLRNSGREELVHYVTTEVEDISRNFYAQAEGATCLFCLHFRTVEASSIGAARSVVAFLVNEHSFELDPLGQNHLGHGAEV
jgi:hypothetical protein